MEAEALLTLGLSPEDIASGLAGLGLRGGRRPYRAPLEELDLREDEEDLILRFALPPGAYATEVLREVTKNEPPVGAAARLGVTFRPEKPLRDEKGEEKI
jgi:tRNA pseudouridine13 synthase